MTNVVCIRHPKYNADNQAPDLSCKMCCRSYVDRILQKQASQRFDAEKWLERKLNGQQKDNNSNNAGRRSY